jgi:hypothetical protein
MFPLTRWNKVLYSMALLLWIKRNWRNYFSPIILLAVIVLFSHFFFAADFGLFEDDAVRVVYPYLRPLTGKTIVPQLMHEFSVFYEGRPLGFFIPQLLVSIFRFFKSLPAIYYLGSSVIIFNAALFFTFVMRLTSNRLLSFIAALIFTLYPADTTHPFLLHIFHIQFGLMFLLLAFLSYLNHCTWLSYIFAVFVLLDYETPYWLFLIAPLLTSDFVLSKGLLKKLFKHALLLTFLFIIYMLLRVFSGESRVGEFVSGSYRDLSVIDLPFRTIFVMIIGPLYSLFSFLAGPYDALVHLTGTTIISVFLAFLFFYVLFARVFLLDLGQTQFHAIPFISSGFSISAPSQIINSIKVLVLGIVSFPLSYILGFHLHYYPVIAGKVSSVHMASAIPGALFIASLLYAGYFWLSKKGLKNWGLIILMTFFSMIVGYRIWIQQDIRLASLKFSRMVAQVLPQIQDVGPETLVLVDARSLEDTTYLPAYDNRFVFYTMLENIYELPAEFHPDLAIVHGYPRVDHPFFSIGPNIYYNNYILNNSSGPHLMKDGDVILFLWDGEKFVRQYDGELFDGISLKASGQPTLPDFKKTAVFNWYYDPSLSTLMGPLVHQSIWGQE